MARLTNVLDRRPLSGNAPAPTGRGAAGVAAASARVGAAWRQAFQGIAQALDRQDRDYDRVALIERMGEADRQIRERVAALDPAEPDYLRRVGEIADTVTDVSGDEWRSDEGRQRAAEAFARLKNSTLTEAFGDSQEYLEKKKATTFSALLDRTVNDIVDDPENADTYQAAFDTQAADLGLPSDPRRTLDTTRALARARISGNVRAGNITEARRLIADGADILSARGYQGAKNELQGYFDEAIARQVTSLDLYMRELQYLGDPIENEAEIGRVAQIVQGLPDDAPRKAALYGRALKMLGEANEYREAVARFETASTAGYGVDQNTTDMVAEYLGKRSDNPVRTMVDVAKRGGKIPTKLKTMIDGVGRRSGNAATDAEAVAYMAGVVEELEGVGGLHVAENMYVEATNLYSNLLGVPKDQAAMRVLQDAPSEEQAVARREAYRREFGKGVKDNSTSLAEDWFDQSMWSDPETTPELWADIEQAHEAAFVLTGDMDNAKKLAEHSIRKRWGYSEVLNKVVKRPPESMAPLDLREFHEDLPGAIKVQLSEDLAAAGITVPLREDSVRRSRARHGAVERWEQNPDGPAPVMLQWDHASEREWKETGAVGYKVMLRGPHGGLVPLVSEADGSVVRWYPDVNTLPVGDFRERLEAADAWWSARRAIEQ